MLTAVQRDVCATIPSPTMRDPDSLSGENAMGWVLRLTCDYSASPPHLMARVPGTPERERAARLLHDGLRAAGWDASYQNFTGADYDALGKGSVANFAQCHHTDPRYERMAALPFSNVVADLGSGTPVQILMAHYESKLNASQDPDPDNHSRPVIGANDGASGVGLLLEFARVAAAHPPTGTLRILLVDGEDGFEDCHPLAGSIYYARGLSTAQRSDIGGVHLLDMVGDRNAHFCFAYNEMDLFTRWKEAARNVSVPAVSGAAQCGVYDDHTAFTDLGMPGIDLIDFAGNEFPSYWHTTGDTPDRLAASRLEEVGRVLVELFL